VPEFCGIRIDTGLFIGEEKAGLHGSCQSSGKSIAKERYPPEGKKTHGSKPK